MQGGSVGARPTAGQMPASPPPTTGATTGATAVATAVSSAAVTDTNKSKKQTKKYIYTHTYINWEYFKLRWQRWKRRHHFTTVKSNNNNSNSSNNNNNNNRNGGISGQSGRLGGKSERRAAGREHDIKTMQMAARNERVGICYVARRVAVNGGGWRPSSPASISGGDGQRIKPWWKLIPSPRVVVVVVYLFPFHWLFPIVWYFHPYTWFRSINVIY